MASVRLTKYISRPTRATLRAFVAGLNTLLAFLTVFSAWGGAIDPEVCVLAALMAMMLPGFLVADIVMAVVDLLWWRKALWVLGLSWVVSLPPILDFAPINIGHASLSEEEQERSFKFMTYNILHFWDFRGEVPGLERNATIDEILDTDPDIVSMQESDAIHEWPLWHITSGQIQELAERYPFRVVGLRGQYSVLSKYPFVEDKITVPEDFKDFVPYVTFYRISFKGQVIHLANCHLRSIRLTDSDKSLYEGLFKTLPWAEREVMKQEVQEVKSRLLTKLHSAFLDRKRQAENIRHVIDSVGGNWIVAGDFNDIPSCYAVRTIMGDDMHDAYAEEGHGPTITYHGNRFYFRIDQMLYKGDFRAVDIRRGDNPASDHYPLTATFVMDEQ